MKSHHILLIVVLLAVFYWLWKSGKLSSMLGGMSSPSNNGGTSGS